VLQRDTIRHLKCWKLQDFEIGYLPIFDRYEVVDMQQDRKVVFSVGSDLHHATEQLVFMPDPNNPAFTIVRHM
jgi:hypothetical protein